MNDHSSTSSSTAKAHGLTAEEISRRAYELWEREGRPESRDLHHWLRAEQELLAERSPSSAAPAAKSTSTPPRNGNVATTSATPPPTTPRATTTATRDVRPASKRSGTPAPFGAEKASGGRK